MESTIIRNIREATEFLRFSGGEDVSRLRIFENSMLVEPGEEVEVPLSWQERWLYPLLHPCTAWFEPWVKTKKVTPMVPMKKAIVTRDGIFVHPALAEEVREHINKAYSRSRGYHVERAYHIPGFLA